MLLQLILLQFGGHLFADFIFQPQSWSDKKGNKTFTRYHIYHILVVFIVSYVCSFDPKFLWAALSLALLHLVTDILKSFLQIRTKKKNINGHYFFIDQAIHLLIIIAISYAYSQWHGINFIVNIPLKTTAIVVSFILCTKPANIIIDNVLKAFSIQIPGITEDAGSISKKPNREKSLPNAGKLIGIMERILSLSLILTGQYAAVGFIMAAKSILRFKDAQRNEYILVGTFLSFGIAIVSAIVTLNLIP